jgi:hypothetical protein
VRVFGSAVRGRDRLLPKYQVEGVNEDVASLSKALAEEQRRKL